VDLNQKWRNSKNSRGEGRSPQGERGFKFTCQLFVSEAFQVAPRRGSVDLNASGGDETMNGLGSLPAGGAWI